MGAAGVAIFAFIIIHPMRRTLTLACILCLLVQAQAQLRPGFDPREYVQTLDMTLMQYDSSGKKPIPASLKGFERVYRSPELGLANLFEVWKRPDDVGVVCIRGTVQKQESWLENFYAAMVPAIGSLHINDSTDFHYKLAADSGAKVHIGWTIGLAHLIPSIKQQILLLYGKGVRQFIITGHSQGGALSFLTRSYLQYDTTLPKDIVYKTYASAAPKPGNLYYAYDFDHITRDGWGFRIVNTLDWVPESPYSIQTLKDMNKENPFNNFELLTGKQKWYVRWYVNSIKRKLDRSTRKAMERYEKYLGRKAGTLVKKQLKGYQTPSYAGSMNYMTAGSPVILVPDSAYKAKYVFTGKNIFIHHLPDGYKFLVNLLYPGSSKF